MITDKIIWPKHYNPAHADINVEAEVAADGVSAEQLWPYLTNISDISKLVHEVVDADPLDSSINDPHLFPKEEFALCTTQYCARLRVLEATAPKDDRAGRITWEGEGRINNSEQTFRVVHAWVLDVDKADKLNVLSTISVTGKVLDEQYFADLNQKWLTALVAYARKK